MHHGVLSPLSPKVVDFMNNQPQWQVRPSICVVPLPSTSHATVTLVTHMGLAMGTRIVHQIGSIHKALFTAVRVSFNTENPWNRHQYPVQWWCPNCMVSCNTVKFPESLSPYISTCENSIAYIIHSEDGDVVSPGQRHATHHPPTPTLARSSKSMNKTSGPYECTSPPWPQLD